jgi:hypothetical protein
LVPLASLSAGVFSLSANNNEKKERDSPNVFCSPAPSSYVGSESAMKQPTFPMPHFILKMSIRQKRPPAPNILNSFLLRGPRPNTDNSFSTYDPTTPMSNKLYALLMSIYFRPWLLLCWGKNQRSTERNL